ncbi:MAG TPA: hypothetical protein VJN96_10700 [Vicinamibacterales bacterium]|nr:hypothetical protein [Vicinamibacterales bacterium]
MTTHDDWLHALRSDPSPLFKAQLREQLRAQDPVAETRGAWMRRALMATAAVIVVAVLTSVPTVRASVARFVSLFRIVNLVGVPVDAGHLDRLQAENLEIGTLIGEHVQVVVDPGPPVPVLSLADAGALAGMTIATPQWLPANTAIMETAAVGERVVRITGDSQRLQQVMDALGITDLAVPPGLDGQVVDVRVPPVVMIRYDHQNGRRTRLFQARTPELTLPDSIDVRALGEIGLRILGLPSAEAKQFAGAIDWQTTLVVPVPPNATSFQQVDIDGHRGVLIQHQPRNQSPTTTIVWSTSERVFALVSIQNVPEALGMATSVR